MLYKRPTNERRRYIVKSSLIGRVHAQNDPCLYARSTRQQDSRFLLFEVQRAFIEKYLIVEPLSEADVLASFDNPYMSSASCPLGALLPSSGGHDPQRHGSITQITDWVCYLSATGRKDNKQVLVLPP